MLTRQWFQEPFDVATINRMVCEHFKHVDRNQITFRILCALFMPHSELRQGNKVFDDAAWLGVAVFGFEEPDGNDEKPDMKIFQLYPGSIFGHMRKHLPKVDLILGHFPVTHKSVLNFKKQLFPEAKTAVIVHVFSEDLVGESHHLKKMDLVFCMGKKVQEQWRKNLIGGTLMKIEKYIPSCPIEMLTAALMHPTDERAHQEECLTGFISGFHDNPVEVYRLNEAIETIHVSGGHEVKLFAGNVDSKTRLSRLAEHFRDQPNVHILSPEDHGCNTMNELARSTYWLVPKLEATNLTTFPLELVFAVGTATPIKTSAPINDLKTAMKEIMEDPNTAVLAFEDATAYPEKLQHLEAAKECQLSYLIDTTSAGTQRKMIERILGEIPRFGRTADGQIACILITTGCEPGVDNNVTKMFRRILYLKGWMDNEFLKDYMGDAVQFQAQLVEACGLLHGNIALRVVEGSCNIIMYCPSARCAENLQQQRGNFIEVVQKVATSISPNATPDVKVEIVTASLAYLKDMKLTDTGTSIQEIAKEEPMEEQDMQQDVASKSTTDTTRFGKDRSALEVENLIHSIRTFSKIDDAVGTTQVSVNKLTQFKVPYRVRCFCVTDQGWVAVCGSDDEVDKWKCGIYLYTDVHGKHVKTQQLPDDYQPSSVKSYKNCCLVTNRNSNLLLVYQLTLDKPFIMQLADTITCIYRPLVMHTLRDVWAVHGDTQRLHICRLHEIQIPGPPPTITYAYDKEPFIFYSQESTNQHAHISKFTVNDERLAFIRADQPHTVYAYKCTGPFLYRHGQNGSGEGDNLLRNPNDIFLDENDYLYIADTDNNRIVILDSKGKNICYVHINGLPWYVSVKRNEIDKSVKRNEIDKSVKRNEIDKSVKRKIVCICCDQGVIRYYKLQWK
eukprot:GHVU01003868.1.p1 GENE.GHVU01003868.1~~GHVU01003868.1.p1  ORF type:complete len:899 (+),score=75.25 GHVU01003868.1:156-2852(+)